jgi:hypothetical protein
LNGSGLIIIVQDGDILLIDDQDNIVNIELKISLSDFSTTANLRFVGLELSCSERILFLLKTLKESLGVFSKKKLIVGVNETASEASFIRKCRYLRDNDSNWNEFIYPQIKTIVHTMEIEYLNRVYNHIKENNLYSILDNFLVSILRGFHTKKSFLSNSIIDNQYILIKVNYLESENVKTYIYNLTNYNPQIEDFVLSESGLALKLFLKDKSYVEIRPHWKNVGQGISTPCVHIFHKNHNDYD